MKVHKIKQDEAGEYIVCGKPISLVKGYSVYWTNVTCQKCMKGMLYREEKRQEKTESKHE